MERPIETSAPEMPIACKLSGGDQLTRNLVIGALFKGVQEKQELPDGYAFRFAGEDVWVEKIGQFIREERRCCPFFTFELLVEPNEGPLWLRLRGPDGVKDYLNDWLTQG